MAEVNFTPEEVAGTLAKIEQYRAIAAGKRVLHLWNLGDDLGVFGYEDIPDSNSHTVANKVFKVFYPDVEYSGTLPKEAAEALEIAHKEILEGAIEYNGRR